MPRKPNSTGAKSIGVEAIEPAVPRRDRIGRSGIGRLEEEIRLALAHRSASRGTGVTAALMPGIAPGLEADEAPLHLGPGDQDVAFAGQAAQPEVGPEPVDPPGRAAAGMGPTQPDDVSEQERDGAPLRHRDGSTSGPARGGSGCQPRPGGYQRLGVPCVGARSCVVAGSARRSTGTTVSWASGKVAPSWATIPPDRVSDPVRPVGLPMAVISNASPRLVFRTESAAGPTGHDGALDDPHVVDRERLRAGVAQLVEEVLDARSRRSDR